MKLFPTYLMRKNVGKIAYHGEILQTKAIKTSSSLDLALGLVLATNRPRFHASPTWFQSTCSQENRAPVQKQHFEVTFGFKFKWLVISVKKNSFLC